jgi:DNA-binding transcriptional LysR family regulator
MPTTLGLHRAIASLEGFVEAHPEIALDVHVGNQVVDFVREGFDLAVRLGPIDDASLVAKRLGDATLGVFASPSYLERHGRPRTVEALADHETIAFVLPGSGRVLPWLFASPNEETMPRGRVRCLEDAEGLIALARAGVGLCSIYHFMVERELADGSLVEVLARRAGRTRSFWLVYPKAQVTAATRALIDHLMARRGPLAAGLTARR